MPSSYKRDDKEFRAQIARLAESGLHFPTAPRQPATGEHCSLFRARPCNECGQAANLGGVPAYVRIVEPKFKRNFSGFLSGLVWWVPIVVIALAAIAGLLHLGGAR